jgi:hypothetical protein
MNITRATTRRVFMQEANAATLCCGFLGSGVSRRSRHPKPKPKSFAAVITVYENGKHADVLLGKILEGWKQDGGDGPALKLASMYVDQFTTRDLARAQSRKHNVPIFDRIEGALILGGDRIAVDGVISICEHGTQPYNQKQQHLYPRRRFFEQITNAFVIIQSTTRTRLTPTCKLTRQGSRRTTSGVSVPEMAKHSGHPAATQESFDIVALNQSPRTGPGDEAVRASEGDLPHGRRCHV